MAWLKFLTYEFFVSLVNGKISEGSGDCTDNFVDFHAEKFDENWKSFFFPDCCSNVYTGLPVAGRQVLNGTGSRFERFWI